MKKQGPKRPPSSGERGIDPQRSPPALGIPRPSVGKKQREEPRRKPSSKASEVRAARLVEEQQAPAPAPEAHAAEVGRKEALPFSIVGIGASAGGLEALEQFLSHVPKRSGMAYVVIQHLDPKYKGAMVELLQHKCEMPVVEATDRQKVEPNRVYIIPPNKDMSVLHGMLHLMPQMAPRGLNLPIDFFFRSLAEDQKERSIAVVLSGMGSDGTLGLRAIKEKAGVGFVQSLSSAKFDGMPRSAIEDGLADVVASAEELPGRILAYRRHAPYMFIKRPEAELEEKQQSALEKIFILLRTQTGNDFSLYKKSTLYRRIERRMSLHQIDKIPGYVRYLRENPGEVELLFKELLIGVTSFFRDPLAWDYLRDAVLPDLLRARAPSGILRAWVPGCSTGEEAYSLAIVLKEAIDQVRPARHIALQIFATDLDRQAIEKARQGLYPPNIAVDVSPERLRKYFVKDDRGFRVRNEIRETVVFAPQNIIMDPPFTKLDLLSCRNLLIYLSPELQKKLIPLFHYALNSGGVLFLGSAETVGGFSTLFGALESKTRLYRRLDSSVGAPAVEFPSVSLPASPQGGGEQEAGVVDAVRAPPPNLQTLADRVIIQRFSPSALLTNDKGDILYISGRTGKYLEPAVGKANLNVFAMAREGLRFDLSAAFTTALRQEGIASVRNIKVGTNGGTQRVDLTVQKLREPKELRGTVLIVISDMPPAAESTPKDKVRHVPANTRLRELEQELQHAREETQSTREEMQTSQEELKSTNEELQSTNEELQSTNEELTTSKEEMQSMNEELQTVNHELQFKVDELSRSNNDMKNLLNSTDIATLFLDGNLLVRRFTTQTAKLIKLIPGDAGRPITDIATDLDYPDLADDAREVLHRLVLKERTVATRDGRWFLVRILPYRTLENVIDGVVITFTDAGVSKKLEERLADQASLLQMMAEFLPNLVWSSGPDGACDYLSRQWVGYTGVPEAEQLGDGWLGQIHPEDRERVRGEWRAAVKSGAPLDTELRIRDKSGVFRWFKMRSMPIRDDKGAVVKWYGTHTDVDELKQAMEARQRAADLLSSLLEGVDDAILALDHDTVITHLNSAAERELGRPREEMLGKPLADALSGILSRPLIEQCREAAQGRRAASLDVRLERAPPGAGGYGVVVRPNAQGTSLLFRRKAEIGQAPVLEVTEAGDP
jgi:two-component system CheB/CheR fusion protein